MEYATSIRRQSPDAPERDQLHSRRRPGASGHESALQIIPASEELLPRSHPAPVTLSNTVYIRQEQLRPGSCMAYTPRFAESLFVMTDTVIRMGFRVATTTSSTTSANMGLNASVHADTTQTAGVTQTGNSVGCGFDQTVPWFRTSADKVLARRQAG